MAPPDSVREQPAAHFGELKGDAQASGWGHAPMRVQLGEGGLW